MKPVRAVKPIDHKALEAANRDFYQAHPDKVIDGRPVPIHPNSRADAQDRQEWMKSYVKHGGKVEPIRAEHVRNAKKQAHANFPRTDVGKPLQACLATPKNKGAPSSGGRNELPKTVKPPVQGKGPICELVSTKLTCEHGRIPGKIGILMVVPDSTASLGDHIDGQVKLKGGCGQHPSWSVGGMWTSQGIAGSFSFNAKTWKPSALGFFTLKGVSPQTYQVQTSACGGGPAVYEIHAYPPGKVAAKLDIGKITDEIRNALEILPVPEEELEKWAKQWFRGSVEYSGAWKEDSGTWKAFYEMSVAGGFDPLFGVAYKGPVYPVTLVPGFLAKWVKAGLFFEIKCGVKFAAAFKGKYWPSDDKSDWSERTVSGGGSGGGALSLELKLASSELVEGSISGETGLSAEVVKTSSDEPKVELAIKFDGIKGKASLKAVFGWVEFSREFQLIQEREIYKNEWLLAKG